MDGADLLGHGIAQRCMPIIYVGWELSPNTTASAANRKHRPKKTQPQRAIGRPTQNPSRDAHEESQVDCSAVDGECSFFDGF